MKNKIFITSIVFVLINLSFISFGKWIRSDKIDNWLWYDESINLIITNNYFWANTQEEGVEMMYHAGKYGFLDKNKKLNDGYYTIDTGEVFKDGVVLARKTEVKNETKEKVSEDSTNIVYAQQGESSGRLLKNYILESQDVEIIKEKNINGTKKNNVITFKQNGAFISIDTKKQNKIILKCERDKLYNNDVNIELRLVVNGEEEDNIMFEEDEYMVEHEFLFKIGDEVDLVMYKSGDEQSYTKQNLYITNGRMSKYKEEE